MISSKTEPSRSAFWPALPERPLVLVTGAAGGLGREIAMQFLDRGARVHLCDIDRAAVEAFATSHDPGEVRYSCVDVGSAASMAHLFADLERWDEPVSVLVNNVGIAGARGAADELSDEQWLGSLQANLLGAIRCVRHVAGAMKRARAGFIAHISSVSVRTLPLSRAPYIVSKAALEAFALSLARELGAFGVRSNVVRPGGMDNERMHGIYRRMAQEEGIPYEALLERELEDVAMRTLISMSDVAGMVIHLASDACKHVTGQIIEVDGMTEWEG